jgi:Bacterial archaeo-eukaryotic release factor family 6
MITAKSPLKMLDAQELTELARHQGPCITIQIPDVHPGAAAGSRPAYLRQLTHEAVQGLRDLIPWPQANGLARSLEQLNALMEGEHGGPGITLLAAPGAEMVYQTPGVASERLTIASRFHLLPLLAAALAPQEFYILGLSKKQVKLWHYSHGTCEERELPPGIPANLEAAGGYSPADHALKNHSAAGPSAGTMRGRRFGTSSDRDSGGDHEHHFFGLIAKGFRETLDGAPVFLIGVREELAECRRAAKQLRIFTDEWHTSPQHCSLAEVRARACDAAMSEYQRSGQHALQSLPEVREKLMGEPEQILKAAAQARVRCLFVAQGAQAPASPAQSQAYGLYRGEDLLNAAAVETLRTGGEVFTIPGDELPGAVPIAAVLRY